MENENSNIENLRRKLTKLMLISMIITFSMLAIVIAAIVYKLSKTSSHYEPLQTLTIEKNAFIDQQNIVGDKIILSTHNQDHKQQIYIYDYKTQKLLTTIDIKN